MAADAITVESAERWLAERRRGIGGSDMSDLFDIEGPFGGCRRRLWYDKLNVPPDVPRAQTDQMLRGKMLEDAAARQYALDTGRELRLRGRTGRVHPRHRWARVNADRVIAPVPEHTGNGILEIKTMNAWRFRRVRRDGLPEGFVLQLQHALLVTGASWGAFMVLHPDTWQRVRFDVEEDRQVQALIIQRGDAFWPLVADAGIGPEPLPPTDVRCEACPWRLTCQGVDKLAIAAGLTPDEAREPVTEDNSFNELVEDYLEAREAVDELSDLQDRVKKAIKTKMELTGAEAVSCDKGRIYYRAQVANRLDTAELKANVPEIYQRYTRPVVSRPLRVFATGGRRVD